MATVVNLSSLTLAQGFKITSGLNEYIGVAGFSAAGDVNNDGIADLIIGDYSRNNSAGGAYVLYGRSANFGGNVDLTTLNSSAGFLFAGVGTNQRLGLSVAGIGDLNHDGIDDFAVGGDNNSGGTGEVYVIFGRADGFTNFAIFGMNGAHTTFDTNAVNATIGARIVGAETQDFAQIVSSAGDFNHDGIDDFLIGAPGNDANGSNSGSVYIVYGQANFTGFNLASLGSRGVQIGGAAGAGGSLEGDRLGRVSAAGDFNGDGKDDIIIGAPQNDATGYDAGSAYVVYGRDTPPGRINLFSFSASDGLIIRGDAAGHMTGFSVSSAGDFNGDGMTDVIVNGDSSYAYPNGPSNGAAYVVFGRSGGGTVNLAGISATNGFKIVGSGHEGAGFKVASAGDLNGDGFGDLLVNAPYSGGTLRYGYSYYATGATYVIFGKSSGFGTINLADTASYNGFKFVGDFDSRSGQQIASAGDLNNDGINDIIVSDGPNTAYVIYGAAPVHTAPSGTDNTLSVVEDGSRALTAPDFGFSDGAEGDAFTAVTIASVSGGGSLRLNGNAVSANQSIAKSEIDAGHLVFTPAANANGNGYASFTFQVQDNGPNNAIDTSANTITFNVTAVNDAPTLSATAANPIYVENDSAVALFSGVMASTGPANEAGQVFTQLVFTVTNVESGHDTLVLAGNSLVLSDGASGTLQGGTSSVSIVGTTATVTVSFTGAVNATTLQQLIANTGYFYNGDNPGGNDRVVTITSLTDNGGIANGGLDTATLALSSTVHITPVDDAAVANDDAFATDEASAIGSGLSLFADNGSGADSDSDTTLAVTEVNGQAAVGVQLGLASGALLTVNADGTFVYDPNGQFDTLTGVTGATNSSATDSFTYTLAGGETATATITIAGLGTDAAFGTAGADTLTGTTGDDKIFGNGGSDTIDGGMGDDKLFVVGTPNHVDGGAGTDVLYIQGGTATLGAADVAGIEAVQVYAGASVDLTGILSGIDKIRSRSTAGSSATIHGTNAGDVILGGAGADTLDGGIGDDQISIYAQPAAVTGGMGSDILYVRGGLAAAFDNSTLSGVETVYVFDGASLDVSAVTTGFTVLRSLSTATGGATITAGDTADIVVGGLGHDTLSGGGGDDRITVLAQPAKVDGGAGTGDILVLAGTAPYVFDDTSLTGVERVILRGGVTADLSAVHGAIAINVSGAAGEHSSVIGTADANRIASGAGGDTIDGGGGADVLSGGGGADTFVFTSLADTVGTGGTTDRILDFSHAQNDKIDLAAIDADPNLLGQQQFSFIGSAAFTGGPGYEIRIQAGAQGNSYIQFDTNHDGHTDYSILVHSDVPLTAGSDIVF